jgi:DNA-3-methyladenine glycosylase I
VAAFGDADVDRLLSDTAIVRHRGKILATINNARATVRLWELGTSLAATLWAYEPPEREPPASRARLPSATAESAALSNDLRKKGFRFVGPTTVYSTMQALGLVNDHLVGCHFRGVVDAARAAFSRP